MPHGTIYSMDVFGKRMVITAGQDKKLNVWNAQTGKIHRQHKQDASAGEPIKIHVDPSGSFFVTSSTDRTIRLYDFERGRCLAKGMLLFLFC